MILAVIVAAAWSLFLRPDPARPPAPAATAPAGVALSYDQLVRLAEQVKALQVQRRYSEALPGARALLAQHELHGKLVPPMLVDYGRMLNNAAFEGDAAAPRSSFERIALEQQALDYAQVALIKSTTPRERAEAIMLVGLVHEAWGFPYDARLTYRAAMGVDTTYAPAREHYELSVSRFGPMRAPGAK